MRFSENRWLIAGIVFVLAFMVAPLVHAGQATVSWQNPTQYTDNTPLAPSDITRTRVEYGSCAGIAFGTKAGEVLTTGAANSITIPNLVAGTYCFRAYTTAKGQESVASIAGSGIVPQAAPKPPTLTTIDVTAYRVLMPANRFAFERVGTVPLKTACSAAESIKGFYIVDRAKVRWDGPIKPSVVVAKCA
jgi:hypothetical protein